MVEPASNEPALRVDGLRKVFRGARRQKQVVAVDHVSFAVQPGEIVGLLGANGAGKTTTIKCICTLVRPSAGRIEVAGIDAGQHQRKAVAKVAAVLEGNRNIYWRMTARENLEFFGALQGFTARALRGTIDELLGLLGLEKKRDVEGRHMSKGMQQKLAIGCCLVRQTPLVLLDEPTLGLDIETSHELRTYLRRLGSEGKTVVLSSHDMAVIEDLCDRVIVLNGGRVVTDDTVANLLELFKTRAYRLEVMGALASFQTAALKAKFELVEISEGSEHSFIDVQLGDSGDIYELIDILQQGKTVIESIDKMDPNLEEIFLRMVTGDGRREPSKEKLVKTPGTVRP